MAGRTVDRKGEPHDLATFEWVIRLNLIGTFNVSRLGAAQMAKNDPNDDGERGVIVNTASIAAFDGQIGQIAYSASKGGVVGMTLPMARDLGVLGIRVMTIAPGSFDTPIFGFVPDAMKEGLTSIVPFPTRMGVPDEFAQLVEHIAEQPPGGHRSTFPPNHARSRASEPADPPEISAGRSTGPPSPGSVPSAE